MTSEEREMMPIEHLQVISEVVSKATPGPLRYEVGENFGYYTLLDANGDIVADDVRSANVKGGANAELFCNAHLWITDLLAEVNRLKAQVGELADAIVGYGCDCPDSEHGGPPDQRCDACCYKHLSPEYMAGIEAEIAAFEAEHAPTNLTTLSA